MAKPVYYFGIHTVAELLNQRPLDALQLFTLAGREDERIESLHTLANSYGISVQTATKSSLDKLAQSHQHQGVVVQARPKSVLNEHDLVDMVASNERSIFLILDQITDPHNLGACLRTAVAMGVTAVISPKEKSVGLTPTACKVSAGGSELVDFVSVTNLARTLKLLKEAGVFIVGTMLDDTAKPLDECDLSGHIGIVMGAEDKGLRRLTKQSCDQLAYLPMFGAIQSLNVSVATGMALYAVRQQDAK